MDNFVSSTSMETWTSMENSCALLARLCGSWSANMSQPNSVSVVSSSVLLVNRVAATTIWCSQLKMTRPIHFNKVRSVLTSFARPRANKKIPPRSDDLSTLPVGKVLKKKKNARHHRTTCAKYCLNQRTAKCRPVAKFRT